MTLALAEEHRSESDPVLEGLVTLSDSSLLVEAQRVNRYGRPAADSAPASRNDVRTETEKDRGRLHYSPFLRRLAGVTQVVSPELTSSRLHSRASHTHKVALIAREIAENIVRRAQHDEEIAKVIRDAGGLDVTACEAAGIAHDLGHPPFGHAGEQELNRKLRIAKVMEGFEGNAQSFRIVCMLDRHSFEPGLQLTNVTLAAILKYPWLRDVDADGDKVSELSKFGAYTSEAGHLRRARDALFPSNKEREYPEEGPKPRQTIEASIMDLADDIAYSIHDLEDFCAEDYIDIPRAILDLTTAKSFFPTDNPFVAAVEKLKKYDGSTYDEQEYRAALGRTLVLLKQFDTPVAAPSLEMRDQQLRSTLSKKIGMFFAGIEVKDTGHGPLVSLSAPEWHDMQILKSITKLYLVSTARMGQIQRAQRKVIEQLFDGLAEWLQTASDVEALPQPLRECMRNVGVTLPLDEILMPDHYRAIADYICGMSDSEALLRSQWITGTEVPGMSNLGVVQ